VLVRFDHIARMHRKRESEQKDKKSRGRHET
jgi:hypothetical protein